MVSGDLGRVLALHELGLCRNYNRSIVGMHRVIMNAPKGMLVDHIDGNGLNNRRSNLRLCTNKENARNARPSKGGSSRYKGVCWHKAKKKYDARIEVDGKRYCLGYFADEIEAAVTYDIKAMQLFGDFAYFNFPKLMQRYKMFNNIP